MVEALNQSFTDCQLACTSPLPRIWVIETLAHSNQVDISLLLDLLEKMPEVSDGLGRNARELVSLRILESFFVQGARENPVSSTSSQKIRLDPSDDSCEDVLRQILTETSPSQLKPPGPEISKWDLQPFIEYKRSSLTGYALQQLKNAMLTGSHSFLASLKGRSRLPDGNQSERGTSVDDGKCNGITSRLEGSDTRDGDLLQRDLPDENLVPVNRKRRATSENPGDESCENLIPSKNGCETHIKSVQKYKHIIICSEQNVGAELLSSGVNAQLTDMSTEYLQQSEGRCSLKRKPHVADMELNGPPNDDECTSKGLVGLDEGLPCENQVTCCDTEVRMSEVKQGQGHDIEEAKHVVENFCDLTRTEDVNKLDQNIQRNIPNVGEVEEVDISSHTGGYNDGGTDIATKYNASFIRKYACTQYSLTTINCRDQNLLVDISTRYTEEERCSLGKKTDVEVMGQDEASGDGNNMSTSLKSLVGHDEVLPHEMQAPHAAPQCEYGIYGEEESKDHEDENVEGHRNGFHGIGTASEGMDKLQQNVLRNIPDVGEADEDVDLSTYSDGYHDERTNIDTKKKTFLSSQCIYSQDSFATTDWRELNLCVKCNLGGNVLVCSSGSCPLVIHHSCLGSDAIFDMQGEFYCPFCAYSRAISKYMEIKKKTALARKDLAIFISLGTPKGSNKLSQRLTKMNQNHLEQDNALPKINELNKRDAKMVSNNKRRKKLKFEQAGPSEYSPPFGRKAVDSTNKVADTMNKDKQKVNRTRQVSQSPKAREKHQMPAPSICISRAEIKSGQVLQRSGRSEKRANIRSNKGILHSPETDLPGKNKSSRSSQSADAEETSEGENDNSGASKYFIRVRKPEKGHSSYPAIPQLRRKRLPWTSEEEEKLKEGMRVHCSTHDKIIPWKKILEHGDGTFHQSRSTMDLKDKWRNMCKSTPKSK